MPAEVQKRLRMLSVPQAWANWWEEVEGSRRQVSGARHWFNSNSSWGCQAATHSLLSLCCSVGWDSNCNRLCWQECEDLGLGFWGLSSLSLCPWWQVSQILQHLWAVRYLTSKVLWSSKDHFVWHTMGGSLQCFPSGWIWLSLFPFQCDVSAVCGEIPSVLHSWEGQQD